jgi:hypothetical protein
MMTVSYRTGGGSCEYSAKNEVPSVGGHEAEESLQGIAQRRG